MAQRCGICYNINCTTVYSGAVALVGGSLDYYEKVAWQ